MNPEVIDEAREDEEDPKTLAAFEAGFTSLVASPPLPKDAAAGNDDEPPEGEAAAAPAPAPAKGKKKDEPAPDVDPFAGLSEPVRDALARVTTLEHDVRATRTRSDELAGRVAALQRENDLLKQRTAPASAAADRETDAPTPPKNTRREKVRGELPEVAEAMDELDEQMAAFRAAKAAETPSPAPAPSPAAATSPAQAAEDLEAQALAALDPDWGTKIGSTAYQLWLSTQPEQDRLLANGTDKAIVLAGYLKRFDKFTAGVETRTRQQTETSSRRDNRTARAAAPPSSGGRGLPTKPLSAEEAFEQAFERTRSGVQ